jgi:hypothetical protein
MDLRALILIHKSNNTLEDFLDGIEFSAYVDKHMEISQLVRQILNSLIAPVLKMSVNQNQNGGIASKNTKEVEKKQSYCIEFNQCINNLIALLGFDFAKHVFYLLGIKMILHKNILSINELTNYTDLLNTINIVKNILNLSNKCNLRDFTTELGRKENLELPDPLTIERKDDKVKVVEKEKNKNNKKDKSVKNKNNFDSESDNDSSEPESENDTDNINLAFNFNSILSPDDSIKNKVLNNLIFSCEKHQQNFINFDTDKTNCVNDITNLYNHLKLNEYIINEVDDLILNLGPLNVGYDFSFLKTFEILYKETFADIPRDSWKLFKPYLQTLKINNIAESCSNYKINIIKYFKNIFNETVKSIYEISTDILPVYPTEFFYEYLADITINFMVSISKNLVAIQTTNFLFGKSTRIQFIQLFNAVLCCAPRSKLFTTSQINTIHYFLLTSKVLKESNAIIESEE